ncbi:DNA-binding transcriptional regulator, LysR family [Loktanella fryxellensis]|uniref:DNA-binding transcriptional regulator, LysR family n=1 Tax=Loktanella fryxellensis TaxID=245187 RepID=A0A1H8E0D7_9RHOB|nr:LysR family transcriptional regulator [Loktanella fryxellensis]SEN12895.1 DNA-binding transcriptional regulator, LysR family [Loktanella fryxellensis]
MADFTWDDLRFFLAVARSGQLSEAARHLRTSHVTVSRRIDRLEQALALRLFERNPKGYALTSHGRALIASAQGMAAQADQLRADLAGEAPLRQSLMRIAAPEGFGSYFSNCILPAFMQQFPGIALELIALPQIMSLSRRETEVSITLDPIKVSTYVSEKLTDYTLGVFGAPSYLAKAPPIRTRNDLLDHPFGGYIEDMIFAPGLDYLGDVHPQIRPVFKSSTIFNQQAAAREGLVLCVLPHFLGDRDPALEPVLGDTVLLRRHYWLNCHRDVHMAPREQAVRRFLFAQMQVHAPTLQAKP